MGQIRLDRGVTAVRETGATAAIFHPTVGWTFKCLRIWNIVLVEIFFIGASSFYFDVQIGSLEKEDMLVYS